MAMAIYFSRMAHICSPGVERGVSLNSDCHGLCTGVGVIHVPFSSSSSAPCHP